MKDERANQKFEKPFIVKGAKDFKDLKSLIIRKGEEGISKIRKVDALQNAKTIPKRASG